MIKIVHFVFLLWSGVVANTQRNGQDRNVTTSIRPSTSIPTTPASSFVRGTNLSSAMQSNSTSVMPPTKGPIMKSDSPKLGLIIGCIAGAVIVVAAVIIICVVARNVRRKRRRRNVDNVPMQAMNELACERELSQEPDHFVQRSRDVSIKMSEHSRVSSQYPPTFTDDGTKNHAALYRGELDKQKGDQSDIPASFYNALAEEDVRKPDLRERRSKTLSMRPGLVKKNITVHGGIMKIDDIELNVGPGCLAKDTEITLIKDDQNPAFKSLLDLDLVKAAPRVVEFLPDGLKFLKPAELSIKYEKIISDAELCILHGSYNRDYQRTVWELVTNDIEDNRADGVVNMKINGFCFFGYIFAERGMLSRILSHLNQEFRCRAYSLYRRIPFMDTIDIVVVLLSEFVVHEYDDKDIQQLKDHFEAGYFVGEKGALQRVHTDRSLEISLGFPGIQQLPFALKVDQLELDSVGFVTDHFKGTDLTTPAFGMVNVYEVHRTAANKLLWKLTVREIEEQVITKEKMNEQLTVEDETEEQVVYRNTKLTRKEISRMSRVVGLDWDSLAGLMDIAYSDREEIRANNIKYPDSYSKAEEIFRLFNISKSFGRHILEKFIDELGCADVACQMLPVETKNDKDDTQPSPPDRLPYENVVLENTPLSPREMYRLSRKIVGDWNSLAGLMGIASEETQNVRCNQIYHDDRSRAEKILSIINRKKDFSRDKLAEGLQGIKKLDLIIPMTTGQWRNL